MNTKHTPGPLVVGRRHQTLDGQPIESFEIRSKDLNGDGDYVGLIYTKDDADHIVKCVNSHDDLLAALGNIYALFEAGLLIMPIGLAEDQREDVREILARVSDAIAKAEWKQ